MKKSTALFTGRLSKLLLISSLGASTLFAHGLWLNSFETKSHGANLVTVGFGTGHNLSIEDSISDRVKFESFDLTTPNGKVIALKKPLKGLADIYKSDSLSIVDSNLAMQKIVLADESEAGTYSANFATKKGIFTKYIDSKGETRFSTKPKEKVRDLKELVFSKKFVTFGKTYFVNKQWSEPKSVGHDLEILPLTDISKLQVGDKIELQVLYKGKELESGFVTAKNALSKNENALYSAIRKGKAKFTLTNNGQWQFNIKHTKKAEMDIVSSASATINIK